MRLIETMSGVAGARWQSDEQLHVTLRFIGDLDNDRAEDVALALGAVSAEALDVTVCGVGAFDTRGHPNAIWAGVAPREPLAALHRKIDRALVRIGLDPEHRAYQPHVTLARMKNAGFVDSWLNDHAGLSLPPFSVDHFLLFESHLGRTGASYEAVARYPLRTAG